MQFKKLAKSNILAQWFYKRHLPHLPVGIGLMDFPHPKVGVCRQKVNLLFASGYPLQGFSLGT